MNRITKFILRITIVFLVVLSTVILSLLVFLAYAIVGAVLLYVISYFGLLQFTLVGAIMMGVIIIIIRCVFAIKWQQKKPL